MTFIADSSVVDVVSSVEIRSEELVELQALELACIGGGIGDTVL